MVDDVDPAGVITLHEWKEKKENERIDLQQRKTNLQRLKDKPPESEAKKLWRQSNSRSRSEEESKEGDEREERDGEEDPIDDPAGSKNDLLNGTR